MKSKTIKTRNLPSYPPVIYSLRVKPMGALFFGMALGLIMLFFYRTFSYYGLVVLFVSLFCLMVLPDRTLVEFTDQYLVMHNCLDKEECRILYWDEMLFWSYDWGASKDVLTVEMVDHSIQKVDCYNRRKVLMNLRLFAKDKERNTTKGKVTA